MRNAFASGKWDCVDDAVQTFCSPEDRGLCRLRYREAAAFNGTFNFKPPIEEWRQDVRAQDLCHGELLATFNDRQVDLSYFKYADDVHNFVLADLDSTLPELLQHIKHHDVLLNQRLGPCVLKQNMSKQEFMMYFGIHQACTLTESDYRKLEAILARFCRIAMAGKATD
ncbi:unnamed protein product, partial [Prorocentrum cordatum]